MWNETFFLPLPVVLSSTYIYMHKIQKKKKKNYKMLIPIQNERSIFQRLAMYSDSHLGETRLEFTRQYKRVNVVCVLIGSKFLLLK
jgi:hypothetical protein